MTPAADASMPERPRLTVGLLNNMPDGAMAATERQFESLLREASPAFEIRLRLFHLPQIERGEEARARLGAAGSQAAAALPTAGLDALVVTGCEPKAPELTAEPYWPALARVIDWTQGAQIPAVWSCLAAHAAVLRLDGVRRTPLAGKCSGVFAGARASDHPLLFGVSAPILTPHSRHNALAEADLAAAGYRVLSRSAEAGVDSFVRRGGAPSLFLQGHPEYDADTLGREYLRDIGRFLRGERPARPPTPAGYFDAATEAALAGLAARAAHPGDIDACRAVIADAPALHRWRAFAVQLFHNWLWSVEDHRAMAVAAPLGHGEIDVLEHGRGA